MAIRDIILQRGYLGNKNLKRPGEKIEWTEEMVAEYLKCSQDPIYFCESYVKIIHVDRGLIPFIPHGFQREMITSMKENRRTIIATARQIGKCISINTPIKVRDRRGTRTITIGELYGKSLPSLPKDVHIKEKELAMLHAGVQGLPQANRKEQEETRRHDRGKGLRVLHDLRVPGPGAVRPPLLPWLHHRALPAGVREADLLGAVLTEMLYAYQGRGEPSVEPRGEAVPVLEELPARGSVRPRGAGKEGLPHEEGEGHGVDLAPVLPEQRDDHPGGQGGPEAEAGDVHAGEVHREARGGEGPGDLEDPTGEVAIHPPVEARGREGAHQSIKDRQGRKNFESRTRFGTFPEREWNSNQDTVFDFQREEEVLRLRYPTREETDRVQRGLLALQPEDSRRKLHTSDEKNHCQGSLGCRQKKTRNSRRAGLRDHDDLGVGLQEGPRTLEAEGARLSDVTLRKFIDVIELEDTEVLSDSGWVKATHLNVTVPYRVWVVETESGKRLECADTHILFDEWTEEVYAMDLVPGASSVMTSAGPELVTRVEATDRVENMFDLTVDHPDHRYYTGDLLSHNTTSVVGFMLWAIIFQPHYVIALLANKGETAREILGKLQLAYGHLPKWLQQGVVEWNKGSLELENGSRIIAAATASDAIRGYAFNFLFIDEAAHIDNWEEFSASVLPTISSGKTTKIVLVSTPNGLNHFHVTWSGANMKEKDPAKWNGYNPVRVTWREVPGRDDEWKRDTLAAMDFNMQKFAQEQEVEFLGSSGTLISGDVLKLMIERGYGSPASEKLGLVVYKNPEPGHRYVMSCDVSEGKGLDYSAFVVVDVSAIPYSVVAVYRNNTMTPTDYAQLIFTTARAYNSAFVLVENKVVGKEVCTLIWYQYEYENLLATANDGKNGKKISGGYGKSNIEWGINTSKAVKAKGCALLKLLVESGKLYVDDKETIHEFATFSRDGDTYKAEENKHDDIVMSLVLFAWLTSTSWFTENTDINTITHLRDMSEREMEEQMLSFGFSDGRESSYEMEEAVRELAASSLGAPSGSYEDRLEDELRRLKERDTDYWGNPLR